MNAVEIEEAVSALAEQPFDAAEFPYTFLGAFGNKDATLRRLRSGNTNKSDVGGVLQRNNIHLCVASAGEVSASLAALRASPATAHDVDLSSGRIRKRAHWALDSTHRLFVQADAGRWQYSFAPDEGRGFDIPALERQLQAAHHSQPRDAARMDDDRYTA